MLRLSGFELYSRWVPLLKSEFVVLQTLQRVFHLLQFVKCWRIFLELNSKRVYQNSEKGKESRCLVFTSST